MSVPMLDYVFNNMTDVLLEQYTDNYLTFFLTTVGGRAWQG
ncbi:Flagellar biosynthetic protein fliR [Bacillus thuringiensis serovar israelensis ATCC 35646]|nr:Flagellar biosynthetic protein fliR [Bacillus thuringiensis serovar israelensis ATCC 35646]